MVFQDPFSSINPVFRVSHGILRGLKLHRPELSTAERRAEAERVFEVVGLTPAADVLRALPARAERRPAAAGRLRPGAGDAAEADPGRRAGVDARRVDPDRPAQPDDRSCATTRACRSCTSPTTSPAPATSPTGSSSCTPARSPSPARSRTCWPSPRHPYTQLLLSAVPDPRAPLERRRRDRPGRAAEGDRPDARLPVPLALPARDRRVPPGDAAADRVAARPLRRLPRGQTADAELKAF